MDDHTTKTCRKCGQTKPLTQFSKQHTQMDGLRQECKECRKAADALRYQGKGRQGLLMKRYGIGEDVYAEMLTAQNSRCALCGSGDPGGRWSMFAVDHCHDTGRVRGLLCYGCNRALGALGDSPAALKRAYEYVLG